MSHLFETSAQGEAPALLNAPMGFASPLWLPFLGAASAGVAFWYMTRWMRPANLEAMLDAAVPAPALAEPVAEVIEAVTAPTLAEPFVEAVETAADAVETVAEAAAQTAVEAEQAPAPATPRKKPRATDAALVTH